VSALADRMRAAGLTVTEHRVAPRPGPWTPTAVLMHHTGGAPTGDEPSLGYIIRGSSTVPGPLSQILVARSGEVHLICEGRANHAGKGAGLAGHGVPADQGNTFCWGIEVESTGTAPDWPPVQWDAANLTARVLLDSMGQPVGRVWRHRDYAPTRKVDTVYALAEHRAAVAGAPTDPAPQPAPQPETPEDEDMKPWLVRERNESWWITDLATYKTFAQDIGVVQEGPVLGAYNLFAGGQPVGAGWTMVLDSLPRIDKP
jgi:N-acetylmuramoyl-L-alanine amidase